MKYAFIGIMVLAIASIVFNAIKLDFSHILQGESQIAVISIVAALCTIVVCWIMLLSYKIKAKKGA